MKPSMAGFAALAILVAVPLRADVIRLKNHTIVRGIVGDTADGLVEVEIGPDSFVSYPLAAIVSISTESAADNRALLISWYPDRARPRQDLSLPPRSKPVPKDLPPPPKVRTRSEEEDEREAKDAELKAVMEERRKKIDCGEGSVFVQGEGCLGRAQSPETGDGMSAPPPAAQAPPKRARKVSTKQPGKDDNALDVGCPDGQEFRQGVGCAYTEQERTRRDRLEEQRTRRFRKGY